MADGPLFVFRCQSRSLRHGEGGGWFDKKPIELSVICFPVDKQRPVGSDTRKPNENNNNNKKRREAEKTPTSATPPPTPPFDGDTFWKLLERSV